VKLFFVSFSMKDDKSCLWKDQAGLIVGRKCEEQCSLVILSLDAGQCEKKEMELG